MVEHIEENKSLKILEKIHIVCDFVRNPHGEFQKEKPIYLRFGESGPIYLSLLEARCAKEHLNRVVKEYVEFSLRKERLEAIKRDAEDIIDLVKDSPVKMEEAEDEIDNLICRMKAMIDGGKP